MKILIFDTLSPSNNFENADARVNTRNALLLRDFFKDRGWYCDVVGSSKFLKNIQYDLIIISYSSLYADLGFDKFFNSQKTSKYIWLTNEYNIQPNGFYKSRIAGVISNFKADKYSVPNLVVNLNTLIYDYQRPKTTKKYDIIYYGTYRENRERYFKKYLKSPLILSTSKKNQKKFKALDLTCKIMDKLDFGRNKETLNLFKSSLYIEDTITHELYNFLANRFYEALYCNVGPFFDSSCRFTIEKSGYYIPDFWVVNSIEEIRERIESVDFEDRLGEFVLKNVAITIKERKEALENIYRFIKDF